MARTSLLAVALLAAAAAAHPAVDAQRAPAPSTEPPAAPAANTRAVRIDAIVTDKHGKAIVNLGPADFAVIENGVAQTVETAVLTSKPAAATMIGPVNLLPAGDRFEESTGDEDAASLAEERAAKVPGSRVIALYLDEFHVSPGPSSQRVRDAVTRFVDEDLRPLDLVVVMKPLDHLTSIRFTRDRDVLRRAAASFEGRRGDYTARTPFEEQYIGRVPGAVRAARAQIVMSGLRALATRVGELESGLAGVVLFTEGFATDGLRSRERRLPDLQTLVRAASRFRVLLYAVDPGFPVVAATVADTGAAADDAAQPTLESLVRETGGDAVPKGGDLSTGLQRVSRDLDTYYVLTYRSTGPSDGRFHNLRVTAARKDANVRARSGYWAPLPVDQRASRDTSQSLSLLLMRPLRRSPLIQSWFGTTVLDNGSRRVIFTWMPSGTAAPGARIAGRPEIVALKVSTPSGNVIFEGDVLPVRAGATGSPGTDSATFVTPPGRLQFDLTIQRADGSTLDKGMEDFDVPELKKGPPVILAPQLFRAASAREFREISADANAAPIPGRDFRRTERLMMRVPTFDPAGANVAVSAKLMNRTGVVLLELSPTGDVTPTTISQFDLPLARFAPGEYSLEVAAASSSGITRQLIYFRITG